MTILDEIVASLIGEMLCTQAYAVAQEMDAQRKSQEEFLRKAAQAQQEYERQVSIYHANAGVSTIEGEFTRVKEPRLLK